MDKLRECPLCSADVELIEFPPHVHHAIGLPDHPGSWCIECDCGLAIMGSNKDLLVAKWNRRPEPENKPLTEGELEQRIGCPVYLVYPGDIDENRWDILTDIAKGIDGYDQYSETAWFTEYEWENIEFIGKHWLAYDRPPGEGR